MEHYRHNCHEWEMEGIGCSHCSPTATALRQAWDATRTCGTCEFYDANAASREGVGYCTNPVGWHRAKPMPPHEMCSKYSPREDA